jgi:predicted RNase H-like HicB family nuclease
MRWKGAQTMSKPSAEAIAEPISPLAHAPFSHKVKVEIEAHVVPEAAGGRSVIVPAPPGCCSQGDTLDEVKANVVEATEFWLECAHQDGRVRH